ncbi:hypothetical protein [Actinoplanes flavus]|uniref:SHOCT domain-containing protein n=1 Tax=Actinoplanes flavus TaxID=2820290 RepID=A0ABS3V064_9ACTN|nr:hypothetical protein [Actinoplanes flavus]MBO3744179.1 hypothetical protein [Actinoplanes flavus]
MEVAAVLIILVIVVTVALVLASAFWPEPEQDQEPAKSETGAAVPEPPAGPTTLEGALVAQLISGEISARQYRRAVAKLAARDDQRQPVRPPTGLV